MNICDHRFNETSLMWADTGKASCATLQHAAPTPFSMTLFDNLTNIHSSNVMAIDELIVHLSFDLFLYIKYVDEFTKKPRGLFVIKFLHADWSTGGHVTPNQLFVICFIPQSFRSGGDGISRPFESPSQRPVTNWPQRIAFSKLQ